MTGRPSADNPKTPPRSLPLLLFSRSNPKDNFVQPVLASKRSHSRQLVLVHAHFLTVPVVPSPHVQPSLRHCELLLGGEANLQLELVKIDGTGAVDAVGGNFHSYPAAAVPRELKADNPQLQQLLDVSWHECGDVHIPQIQFALVRKGRGLASMVVSSQAKHSSLPRAPRHVRVLDRVSAPVYPWPLAIPDAEDALHLSVLEEADLLRPPHRRRRYLLVDTFDDFDPPGPQVPRHTS
mmetsp:Transcript_26263/g.86332  ORF Transcript_26263/g.86332 Transcript_26263/m.86332 type:complete len:237 (-) Transcript_26263:437-1147(-)